MNPRTLSLALALVGLGFSCAPDAKGQTNIVFSDRSFEGVSASVTAPALPGTNTGSIGAWTGSATGILSLGSSITSGSGFSGITPLDGTFSTRFSFGIGVGNTASLTQNLTGVSLVSNSLYQLTIDLNTGTLLGAISGVSIEILAGNTSLATLTGANLVSLLNPNSTLFQTVTLNYTTGAVAPAGNIGVRISGGGVAAAASAFYVDNVRLTQTPIPEPSTVAASLAGAGLLGLVMRRRRALA